MESIKVYRNYKKIVFITIHIILFFYLKNIIFNKLNLLDIKFSNLFSDRPHISYAEIDVWKDINIDPEQNFLSIIYFLISIVSVCITAFFTYENIKKRGDKRIWSYWIIFYLLITIIFCMALTSSEWILPIEKFVFSSNLDNILNYHILVGYLHFFVYIIVLVDTYNGDKINVYPQESKKINDDINIAIQNLKNLNEKKILSNIEYELKFKELMKRKHLYDFKLSPEYKSLVLLKENGILSENEFNLKVNNHINSKVK